MPKAPPSPCCHPGCPRYAVKGGRCEQHQPKAWDHKGKSAADRGYGRRWEKLRLMVMGRDSWLCQECKRRGLLRTATDCDHIVPKARGGLDHPDNLQALCRPCHKRKTRDENR